MENVGRCRGIESGKGGSGAERTTSARERGVLRLRALVTVPWLSPS